MVVTAVAVDLAADLAARPPSAVNIHVSCLGTNGRDQFAKFSGANSPLVRKVGNVRCHDSAGYRCWWRGTGLSSRGSVAQIGAKEHADGTSHALLSKMNMSLLDCAFEVGVTEFPVNAVVIVADTGVEGSITGGRNC